MCTGVMLPWIRFGSEQQPVAGEGPGFGAHSPCRWFPSSHIPKRASDSKTEGNCRVDGGREMKQRAYGHWGEEVKLRTTLESSPLGGILRVLTLRILFPLPNQPSRRFTRSFCPPLPAAFTCARAQTRACALTATLILPWQGARLLLIGPHVGDRVIGRGVVTPYEKQMEQRGSRRTRFL